MFVFKCLVISTFHKDRFILKKLNKVEGKEQYHIEVSNKLAALEDLDAEVHINRA
jgi:hypothetical protein